MLSAERRAFGGVVLTSTCSVTAAFSTPISSDIVNAVLQSLHLIPILLCSCIPLYQNCKQNTIIAPPHTMSSPNQSRPRPSVKPVASRSLIKARLSKNRDTSVQTSQPNLTFPKTPDTVEQSCLHRERELVTHPFLAEDEEDEARRRRISYPI